jgi:hypothetical protein
MLVSFYDNYDRKTEVLGGKLVQHGLAWAKGLVGPGSIPGQTVWYFW